MRELQEILDAIVSGTLLPADRFTDMDCDSILDARDGSPEFEKNWLALKAKVDHNWRAAKPDAQIVGLAEAIRERSFLSVSEATEQHEIASYVSDDFDLIARGLAVGVSDEFLSRMLASYRQHRVPSPSKGKRGGA